MKKKKLTVLSPSNDLFRVVFYYFLNPIAQGKPSLILCRWSNHPFNTVILCDIREPLMLYIWCPKNTQSGNTYIYIYVYAHMYGSFYKGYLSVLYAKLYCSYCSKSSLTFSAFHNIMQWLYFKIDYIVSNKYTYIIYYVDVWMIQISLN